MRARFLVLLSVFALLALSTASVVAARSPSSRSRSASSTEPQLVNDADLHALTTTIGGADVLPTTRTVAHWYGETLDPHNGVTYGYNMVGADPNTCSGSACSTTIETDITPLIVNIGGMTFDATGGVLSATLASPQFATNDYGSTSAATIPSCTYNNGTALVSGVLCGGPGGTLSQGDAGLQLQLQDATQRAQFNRVGVADNYHLILHPNVKPAVTINVPQNQGTLAASGRGVIFAEINVSWWAAQINNLEQSANVTHLPVYLTNNVLLYIGNKGQGGCCIIGFHGTRAAGAGGGSNNSNGNAKVQTFAWASWVQPGLYARPDHGTDWALQDIHALSHEIAEWADDPFVNNTVEPWLTPTAPQYGCTDILETGDPVVAIGFAMGTNTFQQGPNPNNTQSADGYYHPEDEALLPWFMRLPPSATGSEPNQSLTGGRYTFMGDLNPFAGFRAPATGC